MTTARVIEISVEIRRLLEEQREMLKNRARLSDTTGEVLKRDSQINDRIMQLANELSELA